MDTEKEIKNVKQLVENLLASDDRCRNCDKGLTFRVLQHYTKIFIPFEDFEKIPAFETIKRCRAKIQNGEGKFLPTDPVIQKRRQRENIFKYVMGSTE